MRPKWDETVASGANRDTSPTAQVPKLFGPIYATASREHGSSSSGHRRMPRRVRRLSDRDRPPSLYGLNAGIIDRTQFSLLVTVVVLSAIVPTGIAQRWFSPDVAAERAAATRRPIAAGERA
jgi:hypothetical protein